MAQINAIELKTRSVHQRTGVHWQKLRTFGLWILMGLGFGFMVSCSMGPKKGETAEEAFAIAAEYDKDERFDEAIRHYQDVKNRFPYSKLATQAELAIADAYFKQESFAEAQVSYQGFRELHPKHPQTDYVIFRNGLSFFQQLPDTIDRDLSVATEAIGAFRELIDQYPQSTYVVEAKEKRAKAVRMLAEKELYIADFYFKKKQWESALSRYDGILQKYPDVGFAAIALKQSVFVANNLGLVDRSKKYFEELKRNHSDSKEYLEASRGVKW